MSANVAMNTPKTKMYNINHYIIRVNNCYNLYEKYSIENHSITKILYITDLEDIVHLEVDE